MSKPLVIVIPHQLGRPAARQRLETGLDALKAKFGDKLASIDGTWDGDRMAFAVGAMGQTVRGTLDVGESEVTVEVQLPWMLALIAEKARSLIQKEGQILLDQKK